MMEMGDGAEPHLSRCIISGSTARSIYGVLFEYSRQTRQSSMTERKEVLKSFRNAGKGGTTACGGCG